MTSPIALICLTATLTICASVGNAAGFDAGEPAIPEAASIFRRHGLSEPPAKDPGRFRLATYNIHQLYDDTDNPLLVGRRDDLPRAMPEHRRAAVSRALTSLDADIIAIQEVESLEALVWFRDAHLAGLGYDHAAAIDVGHAIGLEQAVLSRFPIIETRVFTDMTIGVHPHKYRGRPNKFAGQPLHFRRSPLMVELDLTGQGAQESEADRLTLLVVHFKTGGSSETWRLAESSALVQIVSELHTDRPERRVVILGDFSAKQTEGHVQPLLESGFHDLFTIEGSVPDQIATNINGSRDCLILAGPNAAEYADDAPRFVLGTIAPPRKLDRDIAFGMPGFASDKYPVVVDLSRPAE